MCFHLYFHIANCAMLFHGIVSCKLVLPRSRRVPFQLAHACRNRKTGFPCPRGRGKCKGGDQCPGRVRYSASVCAECAEVSCTHLVHVLQIDKSHPIHPRREDKVKKVCVRTFIFWSAVARSCSRPTLMLCAGKSS